ncbi:hypothetical protein JCM8547_001879 [Rhodosporidiobolus lusitaniae]
MILGVGVDLLHLPRLRSLLTRRDPLRLARRICSPSELVQWKGLPVGTGASERFLALRWAAKEAAYKALHPSLRPTWKQLEVRKFDKKPFIAFSSLESFDHADELEPHTVKMHLSVSHDADLLVAYVVAERVG